MITSLILAAAVFFLIATATHMIHGGRFTEEIEVRNGLYVKRMAKVRLGQTDWLQAIMIGLIVGMINYFSPKLGAADMLWLAPIFLIIMLGLSIGLMVKWNSLPLNADAHDGTGWKEMIIFIILAILFVFPTAAAASMTTALWDDPFWTSLVKNLPILMVVATVGFIITGFCFFLYRDVNAIKDSDPDEVVIKKAEDARVAHLIGTAAYIITTIVLVVLLATKVGWGNFKLPSWLTGSKNETVAETAEEPRWYVAFYNLSLLKNDDSSDDYNFGYNPREFHPIWDTYDNPAKVYNIDMRQRMKGFPGVRGADVALAAANMAWLDANVGTRYLGEFYESCKNDWAKTMNAAKVSFMNNQGLYELTLAAYFKYLDSAVKVEVKEALDMDDQMYMNPYTVDGIPDIIVMKTNDHTGKFLVYTFNIKGEMVEVAYRIDCGYQPTNVEKVMNITPIVPDNYVPPEKKDDNVTKPDPPDPPKKDEGKKSEDPDPPKKEEEKTPTKTEEPKKEPDPEPETPPEVEPTPPPTPTPDPPAPDPPTPDPPTTQKKDPTKGTQGESVAKNDKMGPGASTNNGVGAQESTKDQPTNSNHATTDESGNTSYDYWEWLKQMALINSQQKTGDDPNTPTVNPNPTNSNTSSSSSSNTSSGRPSSNRNNNKDSKTEDNVTVDSNADREENGINVPTEVTPLATDSNTGESIVNGPDNPAGQWGGPPD